MKQYIITVVLVMTIGSLLYFRKVKQLPTKVMEVNKLPTKIMSAVQKRQADMERYRWAVIGMLTIYLAGDSLFRAVTMALSLDMSVRLVMYLAAILMVGYLLTLSLEYITARITEQERSKYGNVS